MTFAIIKNIIEHDPSITEQGKLIFKSDNASIQYKSKYTFRKMIKLASTFDIEIYWFYGEADHGKGLVDAMSSLAAKRFYVMPLCVMTNDLKILMKWYQIYNITL